MSSLRSTVFTLLGCAAFVGPVGHAVAQTRTGQGASIDLPAQPLAAALRALALRSQLTIIADDAVIGGRQAPAVRGARSVEEALAALLAGSGLAVERVASGFVVTQLASAERAVPPDPAADVLVTGTRIRGSAPVGSPLVTLGRTAIEESGYATTQQVLQALPQNSGVGPNEGTTGVSARGGASLNQTFGSSVNLRGLGASSTLVLIDGGRLPLGGFAGGFVDLSLIPLTVIERIEVLPDGASAIYGSDAVAGVVNVVTRTAFDGAETRARLGTGDGNFDEFQISQIVGHRWATGHVTLAYEYYHRDRLPAADRPYVTEDLRPFGGADYRAAYAAPGTILAGGRTFAIPAGQNGVGLTPGNLIAGQTNHEDQWLGADVLPDQTRHSAYLAADQTLAPWLTVFGEGLVGYRRYDGGQRTSFDNNAVTVPVSNAFYVDPLGTRQPVRVQYRFADDLGAETARGYALSIGGRAGFKASFGSWAAEISADYGQDRESASTVNLVNTARLAVALASSNPATAYDVFGDAHSTSQAIIDQVRGSTTTDGRYQVWSALSRADGPLFALPGGELRLAIGGEHREELYTTIPAVVDITSPTPLTTRTTDVPGARQIDAAYAELLIPLAGPGFSTVGLHRLDVSLAGRLEHYSDFGSTTNPKVGIGWEPIGGVAFRSSFGTSFRAPGFNDLRQGPSFTLYFPIALPDPTSATGTRNALVLRGNSPNVGPEKARTFSAGVDVTPAALPGLKLSATYFDIRYRDRIADPSADLFSFLVKRDQYAGLINASPSTSAIAGYYASPSFINPFGIAAANIAVLIDARTQNLSLFSENGIDADISYVHDLFGGKASADIAATYLLGVSQAITATAPKVSVLGTIGNPIQFRSRATSSYVRDRFNLSLAVNYVGSYQNTLFTPSRPVSSWTTADLQLGYRFGRSAKRSATFTLSVTNLFNRAPPFVENYTGLSAVGYDPEEASALGRVISLQVAHKW